jgi:hypothetical protein
LRTDAWSAVAITLIATVFFSLSWFACRQARRFELPARLGWVITGLPLLVIAFVSVRHVPLAAIWLAPVMARLGSQAGGSAAFRRAWFGLRSVSMLPACLTIGFVLSEPQPVIRADSGALGSRNPCQAVAFMKANGLAGNLFGPLWWGSYVIWNLYPDVRVSMDGRNISLFPDRMVIENFDFFLKDARSVDVDAPSRYDTNFVLVPTDSPVLSRIETDPRWRQGFRDRDAALFLRSDARPRTSFVLPTTPCAGLLQ